MVPVSQRLHGQHVPARNELKSNRRVCFCDGAKRREKKMKKLALCALVLGAGLAASRADVSLGIRIGISDRYDRHAEYRSSHDHNHYSTPQCAPSVAVACPVCARAQVRQWSRYRDHVAYRPVELCADHRRYRVAEQACPPRARGW